MINPITCLIITIVLLIAPDLAASLKWKINPATTRRINAKRRGLGYAGAAKPTRRLVPIFNHTGHGHLVDIIDLNN